MIDHQAAILFGSYLSGGVVFAALVRHLIAFVIGLIS